MRFGQMAMKLCCRHSIASTEEGEQVGSIEERLDKVRELIQDEDFLVGKGLSNEVNIRVFCYEPEDEMAVRRFVEQMLAHPAVNIGGRGRVHQDIRYMRRKIQRVDVPTVYEHRCLRLGTTDAVEHQALNRDLSSRSVTRVHCQNTLDQFHGTTS